jgi:hypothetical protein
MKFNRVGKGSFELRSLSIPSLSIPSLSIGAVARGVFALVAVNATLGGALVNADELKVLDNSGNPFIVIDAPAGATFSVEALTSFSGEGRGLVFLKNSDESFSVSNVIEKKNEQTSVFFEGVESGVYTISSSSPSIVISKVDAIASTQALSKSSTTQNDDSSIISQSAYAVGAAAVAGGIALGASSSGSSSGAAVSGSAINAARVGGSLGEVVAGSGVRNVGSQQFFPIASSNPFFDPTRPNSVPFNPTLPVPNPEPVPALLPFEEPGRSPAANPTPVPAPPVTQPMTLN